MPDFVSSSVSSTIRIPVVLSISYNYGKFKVKPVRSSINSATVEGFSTTKE